MPAAPLPIPKGFRRLNDFALDPSSVFTSLEALESYASTNATAYPGQACAVVLGESVELYVLNADKVPVIASGSGGSGESGLAKYIEARQKILTGETAETTTLQLEENCYGKPFHRPNASNLPDHRGWISAVSGVSIEKEIEGAIITEPLVAEEDFVFFPDHQCFYFTQTQTGVARFAGAATKNFLDFTIFCEKNISTAASHVSTVLDISAESFEVTGVEIKDATGATETPSFFLEKSTGTILFETPFRTYVPYFGVWRTTTKEYWVARNGAILGRYTDISINENYLPPHLDDGAAASAFVATDYFYDEDDTEEWLSLEAFPFDSVGNNFQQIDLGTLSGPKILEYLAEGRLVGTDYYNNRGVYGLLADFTYSEENRDNAVRCVFLTESGGQIERQFLELKSGRISIPKNIVPGQSLIACLSVEAMLTESQFYKIPAFALEKTSGDTDDILHLGWGYPTNYPPGEFTINAQITPEGGGPADTFQLKFKNTTSNLIQLPQSFTNVFQFSFKESDPLASWISQLVVFKEDQQRLYFPQARSVYFTYTAQHHAYQGLAEGGEEIEIIEEIPGIFATTAGTGHPISTLRTLTPSRDYYSYWKTEYDRDLVQIVDDQSSVIYQDEGPEALFYSRPGYTAADISPVTPKLPLAALYPLSPRDDTSFIHVAFTPDFLSAKFASATYPELDDTQRYAADSMAPGETLALSTNASAPVRGLQGVNLSGPKPTFYSGKTIPKITLSAYKWFVVKCKNTQGNSRLSQGAKYLLCVNNVHYDTQSILVNITDTGYNVAADLFPL